MPTVMIVDDDAAIRTLLRKYLDRSGYRVLDAEHAHAALMVLNTEPCDVAICDVHMPGPNGLWLADRIRESSPNTAIILATGDAQVPPSESLRPGIIGYLVKPFPLPDLAQAVDFGTQMARRRRERSAAGHRQALRAH